MPDFVVNFNGIELKELEKQQVITALRKAALNELSNLDLMKDPNIKLKLDNLVNGMVVNTFQG